LLGALQMQLDDDLLVRTVTPGGAADAQGTQQGMRLVSVNGLSLLGETLEEATRQLDGASKPWELVLERMAGKEDTGRTLFQLVQQIKEDVSSSTRTVHLPKLCSTHTPVCPSVCACA
jgi:C-terminal processing protease CtpA/Prc